MSRRYFLIWLPNWKVTWANINPLYLYFLSENHCSFVIRKISFLSIQLHFCHFFFKCLPRAGPRCCLIYDDTCHRSSVLWGSITLIPTVRNNLCIGCLPKMPENAVWVGSSTGDTLSLCSLSGALVSVVWVRPVTVWVNLNRCFHADKYRPPSYSRLIHSEKMYHRRLVCFL